MTELEKVLMERDGVSAEEARQQRLDAMEEVHDGANPEDVLLDMFGLEPDYFLDII